MRLNELSDNPGATKNRLRVGRGVGSGKGKTAGRGVKGQKSRSGVTINGFEGGQMPIYMRLPKRGFNKPNRKRWAELSIANVNRAIEAGKLDAKTNYDADALVAAGVIRRAKDGVRLIGSGKLSKAVNLTVSGATPGAIKAVEAAKGTVNVAPDVMTRREKGVKADKSGKVSKADKKTAAPKAEKPVKKAAPKPKPAPKAKAEPKEKAPAKKAAAKKDKPDDLTKISGIGPVFAKRLADEGIVTYADVAKLTKKRIAELDEKLDLKNNIDNDDWPGQAKALMADKK